MSDVDPKSVACPTCGAKAGRWCKRPSGHSGPFVAFHARRRKAAVIVAESAAHQQELVNEWPPLALDEVPAAVEDTN